eukprot:UN28252
MTAAITVMLGMERLDIKKTFGILIATAGALFIVLFDANFKSNNPAREFGGHVCFSLNCLGTALYVIYTKLYSLKFYPSATVTGYSYITATFGMLITALIINNSEPMFEFVCPDCDDGDQWKVPDHSWWAIVYWILGNSVCAYFLMTWANQHADATVV